MFARLVRTLGCLAALAVPLVAVWAAVEPAPTIEKGNKPDYPRVSLATRYAVDPQWPRDPKSLAWGAVPGVAVDAHDNVFVFVRAEPPVRVYDKQGQLLRTWGTGQLNLAHHLKIGPDGAIWAADVGLHVVRKFTPEGQLLLTLGTPGKPGCDATHLDQPTDMAVTPAGDVFVSDGYGNNRVVQFNGQGKFVQAWGEMGVQPGQFSTPHAIARDSQGRLYVADRNNVRIQIFDETGKLLDVWNDLLTPWGFWITAGDDIWVCGSSPMGWRPEDEVLGCPPKDQLFMRLDRTGKLCQLWTVPKGNGPGSPAGELDWVHCLAVDSEGSIYAGDIKGERIQKFVRQSR